MLSTAELTAMRADVEKMLPETGYILSVTRISDGQGGFTETWGTASTAACRIDPLRGAEQVSGAALQPYHSYQLTMPYGTALTAANRVRIGATTYSVTEVDAGKSWSVSVRAIVERI